MRILVVLNEKGEFELWQFDDSKPTAAQVVFPPNPSEPKDGADDEADDSIRRKPPC